MQILKYVMKIFVESNYNIENLNSYICYMNEANLSWFVKYFYVWPFKHFPYYNKKKSLSVSG